jgi:CMP-N-acetylneuraminic acid synthetase
MKVLAIIPARSGSKGISHKNLVPFRGKPLLAHTIEQARACSLIDRVIVSTDSEEYAEMARGYGAEVPFLRPVDLAGDSIRDYPVLRHALEWVMADEGVAPDLIVHLRPTYPIRSTDDIAIPIRMLLGRPDAHSIRSVCPAPITPYKMWLKHEDNTLHPLIQSEVYEAYNAPRQELPTVYAHNGCVDVIRSSTILTHESVTGPIVLAYEMREFIDIDDMLSLEQALTARPRVLDNLTFAFDIDGVLATPTRNMDYAKAEPMEHNIALVNALFERGNTIRLYTARGSETGIDWKSLTKEQMFRWGVHYHELYVGKPAADFYIDDRMVGIEAVRRWLDDA